MIRPADVGEANLLTQIALDAKAYWGYPEHWIKRWEADLTISPEFIRDHHVYVAELEHMWVTPGSIGTGVGKELFLHAMERAAALEVRDVEITADPNAAGFYKRMGATQVGETDAAIDDQPRKLPRLKINPS